MKKLAVLSFASLFILTSCGGKNDKNKTTHKDSLETKVEVTLKDAPPDPGKKDEPKIVDSNDVITNTEILNEKGQLDPNSSPIALVQTIIKAAKTHKYGPLIKLCNESIDMDGDAKDICGIGSAGKDDQKDFDEYFGNASIVGKARIKNGIAEVDIQTTAEGGSKETIVCQAKYDRWYLKGL